MSYRRRRLFVNGEGFQAGTVATRWLRRLADERRLDPPSAAQAIADPACSALLHQWHAAGWLRLGSI